jgi:hypothetical protein
MTIQAVNIELDYDPNVIQASEPAGIPTPSDYIGSGTGQASGDIEGVIKWDLYEDQALDKCDASFVGTITSESGEELNFHTRGILLAPTAAEPGIYRTNSEVTIGIGSPDKQDAGTLSGDWVGTFDSTKYHHSYVLKLDKPN